MNSAPAVIDRPFPAIYRQFPSRPETDVQRAIAELVGANKSVTVLRVREILDTPALVLRKPAAVIPMLPPATDPAVAGSLQRVAATVTARGKVVSLASKLAACAAHPGLSDKEEADFQRNRSRFPHMGYWPAANAYESECICP